MKTWRNIVIGLVVVAWIVGVFRVPLLRAVSAAYNSTVRIVNSTGTVINGTASAVTAAYNQTVQVVDSTGHVIDSFSGGSGPVTNPALGNYNGSVGLTGNQGNGSDFITGVNLNNEENVLAYGASGSNATGVTATCAGSGTACTLSAAGDYKNKEYILLVGAGPAALYATPGAPTLTNHGTAGAGSTTYTYLVVTVDAWGGYSAAGPTVQTTTGPAILTELNYQTVNPPAVTCSACSLAVYRQTGGAGNFIRIGIMPGAGGALGDTNLPEMTDSALPLTIPSSGILAAGNQNLVAQITAGGGTTAITIDTAVNSTGVTGVAIYHDDTHAFQTALNAIGAAGGGVLDVPPGTYNFDQIGTWNNSTWVYTNPTVDVLANRTFGLLHLPSNVWVRGAGRGSTILQVPLMAQGAIINYVFAAANPVGSTIPGAPCNIGLRAIVTTYPINAVTAGSSYIVTTTASNAGNFNPGDIIFYGGGIESNTMSCASNQPRTEPNRVLYADTSTGRIYTKYPVTTPFPYGPSGGTQVAAFVGQVNAYYHHDIYITDMSMPSIAGGAAVGVGASIAVRLARVDMIGEGFSGKVNCSGTRDFLIDDVNWESTGSEQFDSCYDVVVQNSFMQNHSGGIQFSVDESSSGLSYLHDVITADDALGGIGNRAAGGTVVGLNFKNIVNVKVHDTQLNMNTVQSLQGIANPTTFVSTIPVPISWDISNNIFNLQSAAAVQGFATGTPIYQLSISRNQAIINAGSSASQFAAVLSGSVDHNLVQEKDNISATGLIGVANSTASLPADLLVTIDNNQLELAAGVAVGTSGGIRVNSTAALPVYITNNTCNGLNNCILDFTGTVNIAYMAGNIAQNGTNLTFPTILAYGDGCKHGFTIPTSAGSGTLLTGSTDCQFQLTSTTAFPDVITFHQIFQNAPTCACSDTTTRTTSLGCSASTTTAEAIGGAGSDAFTCTVTGF